MKKLNLELMEVENRNIPTVVVAVAASCSMLCCYFCTSTSTNLGLEAAY